MSETPVTPGEFRDRRHHAHIAGCSGTLLPPGLSSAYGTWRLSSQIFLKLQYQPVRLPNSTYEGILVHYHAMHGVVAD